MNGLESIRTGLAQPGGPDRDRASLERLTAGELAREFESVMILQMLRQMRQAMVDPSQEGGMYASAMLDTIDVELARHISRSGGVGLAAAMTGALARQTVSTDPADGGVPVRPAPAVPAERPAAVPAAPAVNGGVTSGYGWRDDPFDGGARFHGGIDLRAGYGQPVPAAAAGRVIEAREAGGYGLTIVIAHPSGVRTRYAHLSALTVAEGDEVAQGQEVGRVGRTGRATGPHLHFEVIQDGKRINPDDALVMGGAGLAGLKLAEGIADSLDERRTPPAVAGADHEHPGH
ncbi:MAG: peptidoglycan DD-metalloendopeptidase family protein [Acidobacteriota bacterium]